MASKSIRAIANPQLLDWARKTSGYDLDTAAQKIGVTSERLAEWESGADQPTMNQLRKAAQVYQRPLAAFYLSEPPKDFSVPHDYRRLSGVKSPEFSPELRAEIRRIYALREVAVDLTEEEEEPRPNFIGAARLTDDVEERANWIRALLTVTWEEQSQWRDAYTAFNNWRALVENQGVLVTQIRGVPVDEMRGLSISAERFPVLAVNVQDTPYARVFSLLHEFSHLCLNVAGLCDLTDDASHSQTDQQIESFCNALAATVLVPREHLIPLVGPGAFRPRRWSDSELENLSRAFAVSREVIVRRLLTLGGTTRSFYEEKRAEFIEQAERARKAQGGFAAPSVIALNSVGPLFARIALGAYDRAEITSSDLADYLGVRVKHFGAVREKAFGLAKQGRG